MYNHLKAFLLMLLAYNTACAQQRFITDAQYPIYTNTLTKQYCAHIDSQRQLCQSYTLSYPDANGSKLPAFFKGLNKHIQYYLNAYLTSNPKKEILQMLPDADSIITGEWYDNTNITLFAKTPSTYTLSIESNGYSGGAHGDYGVGYINIDIRTQKELSLSDLFLSGYLPKLRKAALAYYKKAHNLSPSTSLEYDGWFENKFKLAQNVAITPIGLYFLYNEYEIKPYAEGLTDFIVPYSAIQEIIDPKGPLAFALNTPKNTLKAAYENKQMKLFIEIQRDKDEATITAHLYTLESADIAWLSVSLPQIDSKRQLLSTGYKGFDHLIPYDTRSHIYNGALNKSILAQYLLVEGDKHNVDIDEHYTMWFRVKIPHTIKDLIVDIRATLKDDDMTYTLPEEYEGIKGQQGFKNYRMILPL